ncbi:DNA cytosine methyltransferase [Brevundimonas sp. PAMC22021]|uniref:DNA cytosine methyltransferase n=1 Tax=Brevundimonas sp. PAMC22021 TaxID=2861285 RepID=UPI001C627A2A|nr:DNA cytosine methyltransferase [Brevundimonas sp. PAMC22021]QYF86670.1 DNA cytosine methyltransferase [Brevundimonas sp. PAMC22021]
MSIRPVAHEFFAGGGLAGIGLSGDFDIGFANDMDAMKAAAFRANHPQVPFHQGDVWDLGSLELPGRPDLCWASSPCQDVSLAGARGGLEARRSGAFWGFWRLMQGLEAQGRAPRLIVLENVVGLLSSGGGADFAAVCWAMTELGYVVGALEIDAALWLPQSRPRLFVVAMKDAQGPSTAGPRTPFHSPRLIAAQAALPDAVRRRWRWWSLTPPPLRNLDLASVLAPDAACDWFDAPRAEALLSLLAPLHRQKLEAVAASGERRIGAAYRRVRREGDGKHQRLELRFDGLAGCLRTPAGGSSRQYVVAAEQGRVRIRYLTAREAARLMGLPDDYRLPARESAGLKLTGDAVAVPVVRTLSQELLRPALTAAARAA